MAATAHGAPVCKGLSSCLLGISLGSLHSCHPWRELLEAWDSLANLFSLSFPHPAPPKPQEPLPAPHLETIALSLLLQN